jgi:hypothetical protein
MKDIPRPLRIKGRGRKKALAIAIRKNNPRYILYTKKNTTLFEVLKNGRDKFELKPLYHYAKDFKPKVRKHSFMNNATMKASATMEQRYFVHAMKQLEKFKNK